MIPEIGEQKNYNLNLGLRPSDKLSLSYRHRKIELSKKYQAGSYFSGSVDRFTTRYSFNNDLSWRVNLESNDFSDDYYLETLFEWRPDPYTIFYAGSSQFFSDGESSNNVKLLTSQIYLKFQYFYKI